MVVFNDEDRILIKKLYELKGCGAKQLIKELPPKGWKLQALNKLLRKMKDTGTNDRRQVGDPAVRVLLATSTL